MRNLVTVVAALILFAARMSGQTAPDGPPVPSPDTAPNPWEYSFSAYTYLLPDEQNYVNPNFTADHGGLHLEARYNYEALKSGSLWVGYNFSVGKKVVLAVTPMLGGVFGNLTGVAPGYELTLSLGKFELSSQSEYVFDTRDTTGNFFYTWSEFSYSPIDWFRIGLVTQRTKAYQTEFDIQRGVLAGFSYKKISFTTYVFNFGWTDPTVVLAAGVNF